MFIEFGKSHLVIGGRRALALTAWTRSQSYNENFPRKLYNTLALSKKFRQIRMLKNDVFLSKLVETN